jgi:hypothetical protein
VTVYGLVFGDEYCVTNPAELRPARINPAKVVIEQELSRPAELLKKGKRSPKTGVFCGRF